MCSSDLPACLGLSLKTKARRGLQLGMQRLTNFTINRNIIRLGYVTVKEQLHSVFLFSLSKKGDYGRLHYFAMKNGCTVRKIRLKKLLEFANSSGELSFPFPFSSLASGLYCTLLYSVLCFML